MKVFNTDGVCFTHRFARFNRLANTSPGRDVIEFPGKRLKKDTI